MAEIIDGRAIARAIQDEVAERIRLGGAPAPKLQAIALGADPATLSYSRSQAKLAARLGIDYSLDALDGSTTEEALLAVIRRHADDPGVTGIMLHVPLPRGIDEARAQASIPVGKDVEATGPAASARLFRGQSPVAPCTALAAFECLRRAAGGSIDGMEVAVVGRSAIVGRPLAMLLLHANATVTIAHSRTRDLAAVLRRADAVVAAVGKPALIRAEMLKPGAIVVDVGTNSVEGPEGTRLVGDVDFASVAERAGWITPVPGGVGPVTVAILMRNLANLADEARQRG